MTTKKKTKIIHEGKYIAELTIDVHEDDTGWSPYLSAETAYLLDDVRDALRRGDLAWVAKYGTVYTLTPVAV